MGKGFKKSDVRLVLSGKVVTAPELVSRFGSTKVLGIELETVRLSGVKDRFVVHYANTLGVVLNEGQYIKLNGDIRTVNAKDSENVVYPFVMASEIEILDDEPKEYLNDVSIKGAELIQFDEVRNSYTDESKQLATYRIRLVRKHNRASTFRVTTWGRDAIFLGNIHKSIETFDLKCRLQSYVSKESSRLRFGLISYCIEVPDSKSKVGKVEQEVSSADGETA